MRGFIAPAGTPVEIADLFAGLVRARGGACRTLETALCQLSGTTSCWTFSSGRAAMVATLIAMRRIAGPARDRVVIPGYTCYSVPAAVEKAGLRPILCDVDPHTLSVDSARLEAIDFSRVLVIVSANLYGIPNALSNLEAVARRNQVFLLDDAAQSLGARMDTRPVGGFGDAGLYSFDKGKNVPTMQGGAIVSRNHELARELDLVAAGLPAARLKETLVNSAKLLAFAFFLRPDFYAIVRRLPGLTLGTTVYDTRYSVTRYSEYLAGVALRLVRRIETLNARRKENARLLSEALLQVPGVSLVQPLPGAEPVYVRLPILMAKDRRNAAIAALNAAGIGATASYPEALIDVPEVRAALDGDQEAIGARAVARRIVTLPTHAYCPPDLPSRVRKVLESSAN